jgi:hypothetical protein
MLRGAGLIMRYLLAFALDRDGAETSAKSAPVCASRSG